MMRVHAWSGGSVRHLERLVRRDGRLALRTLPARFGIIEHPDGPVVFDTGYHPSLRSRLAGAARAYHRIVPWRCPAHETVGARLRELGFAPEDVQLVVLSHLHADHIAGLVDLPGVPLVLTHDALHAIQGGTRLALARHGYFTELLPPDLQARARLVSLPTPTHDLHESSMDLLGDGRLRLVALPGHAPGQLGLWVRRESLRDVLFLADASFSHGAIQTGATPSRLFMGAAFEDIEQTRATLARLKTWSEAMPDLALVACHAWEGPAEGEIR